MNNRGISGICGLLLFSLTVAQTPEYRSQDGQLIMTFHGYQFKKLSGDASRLIIDGGIHVRSLKDSLDITAGQATAAFTEKSKQTHLNTVHAVGGVKITKSAKVGNRRSTIASSVADYRSSGTGSSADFMGSVVLTDIDQNKRTIVRATGSTGHAVFSSPVESKSSSLTSATLRGGVVIHLDQAGSGSDRPGHLVVNCAEMNYLPSSAGGLLKLTGKISMHGENGAVSGTMQNLDHATIHLSAKNEATEIETGAGK